MTQFVNTDNNKEMDTDYHSFSQQKALISVIINQSVTI